MAASPAPIEVKLTGLDNLRHRLRDLPQQLRRKVLIKALRKAAAVVLREARAKVPVLSSATAARTPYRKPGTVKRALTVRVSKVAQKAGNVGVFIGVKPAAGAKYQVTRHETLGVKYSTRRLKTASKRGAKSPDDPYYWRWLEFGTAKMSRKPFIQPAAEKLPEAMSVFEAEAIPAIEALNRSR